MELQNRVPFLLSTDGKTIPEQPLGSDFAKCVVLERLSLYEVAAMISDPIKMNRATEAIGKANSENDRPMIARLRDRVIEILNTQGEVK